MKLDCLSFDAHSKDSSKSLTLALPAFVDCDYEEDLDERKFTSVYIFNLASGCVSCEVSWRYTKQKCISQLILLDQNLGVQR